MNQTNSIHNFFYPKSIVLIGASSKQGSIGYEVLRTIKDYGFRGKIYVQNPGSAEILGIKCYKMLSEIEDTVDLAIILVPKKFVFQSVKECAEKGIKNIVIITAGFKETGKEGAELEGLITAFAKQNGIRLTGPNCMGLINSNPEIKLNATFAAELPQYAKTGFISQSGALGAAILNTINLTKYKFNQFISIGNKADVNENDIIEYWKNSEDIVVITMYLESFSNGKLFIEKAKEVIKEKPVIVLKAAKSEAGIKAASSHTGALASADVIVNTALNKSGAIRVNTIEELFETANALQKFPLPKGNRIAVITNAGGPAILCTDELEKNGLSLATLSEKTIKRLNEILSEDAGKNNPVDMLPMANADMYGETAELLLNDDNVDGIIAIFVEPIMIKPFDVIHKLAIIQQTSKKPLLISVFPLPHFWQEWEEKGIKDTILYKSTELPAVILANLFKRYNHLQSINKKPLIKIPNPLTKKTKENLKKLINKEENGYLNKETISGIAGLLSLPMTRSIAVKDFKEAKAGIRELEYPLALKIISDEITHKSDTGGVILNIKDKKELKKAFEKIEKNLRKKNLIDKITGYEIQEFVTGGIEVIIGGYRDSSFGPVIMFGAGGKLVEILKDTNFALCPANYDDALSLVQNSKIYPLLKGYRGEDESDISIIVELIVKMSEMFAVAENITEFDINPLIVKKDAIDSRIVDIRIKKG